MKKTFLNTLKGGVQLSEYELSLAGVGYDAGYADALKLYVAYEHTKRLVAQRWIESKDADEIKEYLHSVFGELNGFELFVPFNQTPESKRLTLKELKGYVNGLPGIKKS